ncbi:hypothetical protein J6590_011134 [Homalodisca vitripennis]|nr:hypothetical protein J6590_011134 [Homalodisca vitripennis]
MVNNHHPITTADTLHVIVGATVPGNNAKREPCTARGWAELFNNGKLFGLEEPRGELNDLMSVWLEKDASKLEKICILHELSADVYFTDYVQSSLRMSLRA